MAHGRDANHERAVEIALAAQKASLGLDADRSKIYFDLILNSLGEAARQALKNMDTRKYEYQSDFARQYIAQGRAEGAAEGRSEGRAEGEALGRAALIVRQLILRFGPIEAHLQSRIQRASIAELEAIGERLLAAHTLQEALG
jgi:predicted transposase YdaD